MNQTAVKLRFVLKETEQDSGLSPLHPPAGSPCQKLGVTHVRKPSTSNLVSCQTNKQFFKINLPPQILLKLANSRVVEAAWPAPRLAVVAVCLQPCLPIVSSAVTAVKVRLGLALALASPATAPQPTRLAPAPSRSPRHKAKKVTRHLSSALLPQSRGGVRAETQRKQAQHFLTSTLKKSWNVPRAPFPNSLRNPLSEFSSTGSSFPPAQTLQTAAGIRSFRLSADWTHTPPPSPPSPPPPESAGTPFQGPWTTDNLQREKRIYVQWTFLIRSFILSVFTCNQQ